MRSWRGGGSGGGTCMLWDVMLCVYEEMVGFGEGAVVLI